VLSLFGLLFSCGALTGLLSDRIGRESTITLGTIVGISGIVALSLTENTSHPWMLVYYSMALGFGLGITTPTIAAATTDIFQGPHVGAIIGFVWFAFAVGGFIGPWLGGWIFEFTESYLVAFFMAIALFVVSCAALWWAAPRKVRVVPGRAKSR
jgi:MFS family permease